METKTYDFSKVAVTKVDGTSFNEDEFKSVHFVVANKIYIETKDISLVETAMTICKGEAVQLSLTEAKAIRTLVCGPDSTVFAFIRKAVGEYMDTVEK